jgi:hypothetical protein
MNMKQALQGVTGIVLAGLAFFLSSGCTLALLESERWPSDGGALVAGAVLSGLALLLTIVSLVALSRMEHGGDPHCSVLFVLTRFPAWAAFYGALGVLCRNGGHRGPAVVAFIAAGVWTVLFLIAILGPLLGSRNAGSS